MIRWLLNLIWFVLGGLVMGLGWWLAGLVAALTIVGLPWARACFVIGNFSFFPFGKEAVSRLELTGRRDLGTGPLGFIGNVIWFLVAGMWLAIGHLSSALACFVTIIGIPFGWQHLKLAVIALAPIGVTVVPVGAGGPAGALTRP
ncbi:YccF domain-containing protein [Cyanobium sp. ATX 6F1]|uniref:YccF domain-containing protein n=1 Tax=Cyanobium sp. ATX 6F1 TaxID=2823702 RepID=UPI0020CC4E98|nr:YccF domain-containing protein [Cyanobium sp. ATX 6F1]MCP9915947.1 YccF domain-containing protein [Cyanobium sp. ATX 6F1]